MINQRLILVTIVLLVFNLYDYSQSVFNLSNKPDSAIVLLSENIAGFGPGGNMGYGIGTKDGSDSITLLAYPKVKNLPDSLTDLKEYCFEMNEFQFVYQNYRKGIFNKKYLLEKAEIRKWRLADTTKLSVNSVKNIISIVSGVDSKKNEVYIVDANNNNDFSDDTLRFVYENLYSQDDILINSHYVDIEYYDGESVKQDKILFLAKTYAKGENLSFAFPQFRYGKIAINDKIYLVCAQSYNAEQSIFVAPDIPYFGSISKDKEVKPYQYINFNDTYYKYIPFSQNSNKIKIIKANISEELYNQQNVKTTNRKTVPLSNQVGMLAPPISGVNIFNDSVISLGSYIGKYVFLDFWSTSCGPCIKEFPYIKQAYELFSKEQFEIIGVVDDRTNGKIKKLLTDKNVIWPNIDMKAATNNETGYTINSFPTSYLIAPDGKIITTNLRGEELMHKLESLKIKKN